MTEVVAALIWQQGRFLICQRPEYKARGTLWEFVGGKVEAGESGCDALIRECHEELDITVRPGKIFYETMHQYPDLTIHLTVYEAEITAGTPKLLEHMALAWIKPCEIPNYEFCPADQSILAKIQELS